MTARRDAGRHCPHCGEALDAGAPHAVHAGDEPVRYDLEELSKLAASEKAYDETVKVRVTQDDIRRLVEKRRKKPK
jgi:diaminopimelate epimerase